MTDEVFEPEHKMLPRLDIRTRINNSPHVVILGAGASRACCPNGDKNGKPLPLMADFVDKIGIHDLVLRSGHIPTDNFEKIYSDIYSAGDADLLKELDETIRKYFDALLLPDEPTLYDYLVLSLRPKDSIVTFNWDPLLIQAYKRWRHLGGVLPELVFLHGNVDLGIDREKKIFTFLSDQPTLTPTHLLYPVEKKGLQRRPLYCRSVAKGYK